ncbi:Fumarate hydratase class II [Frankliniella fusca]|uniref:Fumarate hydratase class II n=1 Tax=Frankliniella fusca TaxID=407009 RepID=A0AAE1HEC0_9NEOP|nr:Fumarate hydratase class II [Frankliniella fusca]
MEVELGSVGMLESGEKHFENTFIHQSSNMSSSKAESVTPTAAHCAAPVEEEQDVMERLKREILYTSLMIAKLEAEAEQLDQKILELAAEMGILPK